MTKIAKASSQSPLLVVVVVVVEAEHLGRLETCVPSRWVQAARGGG